MHNITPFHSLNLNLSRLVRVDNELLLAVADVKPRSLALAHGTQTGPGDGHGSRAGVMHVQCPRQRHGSDVRMNIATLIREKTIAEQRNDKEEIAEKKSKEYSHSETRLHSSIIVLVNSKSSG